jgi:pterin-4a-carbinolamine dehydratase
MASRRSTSLVLRLISRAGGAGVSSCGSKCAASLAPQVFSLRCGAQCVSGISTGISSMGSSSSSRLCSSSASEGRKGGSGEGAEWEVIGAKQPPAAKGASWTVGDEKSTSKKCDPYEQGGKPLDQDEAEKLRSEQVPEWVMAEDFRSISRTWRSEDFLEAAEFVKRISILSQNEGHQPRTVRMDLVRGKEELVVILSTPRLKGLSYADVGCMSPRLLRRRPLFPLLVVFRMRIVIHVKAPPRT